MTKRAFDRATASSPSVRSALLVGAWALGLLACSGSVGGGPGGGPDPGPGPGSGGAGVMPGPLMGDVNRVAIHRLNNAEYDNTVRDLLGVAGTAVKTFPTDESILGFDTIADAFGMTPAVS